jgi:hypothetical protein
VCWKKRFNRLPYLISVPRRSRAVRSKLKDRPKLRPRLPNRPREPVGQQITNSPGDKDFDIIKGMDRREKGVE